MTMVDSLFGLIPAASTGQQWVALDLQLVNWGGYDGHHRVRLASTATLLSGGSGSGKSTLMDAYIALLMPHTTPFNGASNGGVVGRPRGKDQRNILSYARGKLDESRTEGGTRESVLRGAVKFAALAAPLTWSFAVLAVGAKHQMSSVAGFLALETGFFLLQYAVVSPLLALAFASSRS